MEHDLLAQKRTAYALGELDAAERAVIEADLATSEAHKLEVEEIRALSAAVAGALKTERKPALSEIQHLAIEGTLQRLTEDHEQADRLRLRKARIAFWIPTSLAASALFASGITLFFLALQNNAGNPIDSPSAPGDGLVVTVPTSTLRKPIANKIIDDYNKRIVITAPIGAPASYGPHVDAVAATENTIAVAFHPAAVTPLSTFPLAIDTTSYEYIQQLLEHGSLPPRQMVHIESMVNAYRYDDVKQIKSDTQPVAMKMEISECPWNSAHKLARIVVKARDAKVDGEEPVVAEDVRVRVEFNPARVASYRLIGYENRLPAPGAPIRDEGTDLRAGHTLTVLYEIVPVGSFSKPGLAADALRYQQPPRLTSDAESNELFNVAIRFRTEENPIGELVESPAIDPGIRIADASGDFKFAAAVAQFGLVLLDSETNGPLKLDAIRLLTEQSAGPETPLTGDRAKFLRLLEQAQTAVN